MKTNLSVVSSRTRTAKKPLSTEDVLRGATTRHLWHMIARYVKELPPETDVVESINHLKVVLPRVIHMVLKSTKHMTTRQARGFLRYMNQEIPSLIDQKIEERKKKGGGNANTTPGAEP